MLVSSVGQNNVADLLLTCSDGNIRWKFLYGSFIPRRRLDSVIPKYSIHTGVVTDILKHIFLESLDSSGLEIIPHRTAIPGFQTEMTTKRQNFKNFFSEWESALFAKCAQTLKEFVVVFKKL